MRQGIKHLRVIVVFLLSSFLFLGCSKDDNGEEGLEVNFIITISPEGSGTVETRVIKAGYGIYGIEMTAIPFSGFSFSHWE